MRGVERRGRLLLLSYYWPPSAGVGVQRWLKLTKYLVELGWEIVVYTPSNPDVPVQDASLYDEVPAGVRVVQRRIFEPYAFFTALFSRKKKIQSGMLSSSKKGSLLQRFLLWVRANIFIPDARFLWIEPSARFLHRFLRREKVDAIISTGPPHSLHLIALRLHRSTGVPWLADFRDPWVNIDYMQHLPLTRRARCRHERLERRVLEQASAVTVVSGGMHEEFAPLCQDKVHIVPNGYDPADFPSEAPPHPKGAFEILHLGSMNADRNPELLWRVLASLSAEGLVEPEEFRVKLVGLVDSSVRQSVMNYGLEGFVSFEPYVDHSEVPARLRAATALLLCVNATPNRRGILTGKLFEYLASRRPIILIGPTDGDAAHLLRETGAGDVFGYSDVEGLRTYLLESMSLARERRYEVHSLGVERYSRRGQAQSIDAILRSMVGI